MTTMLGSLARACAGAVLLVSVTACGSGGSDAVTSSRSLDQLGAQLAKDGDAARLYLAGSVGGPEGAVSEDASKDVSCAGGSRRTYRASFSGPTSAAGGDHSTSEVRNTEGLAAQVAFKRVGYDLAGDVAKSGKDLPATLEFTNDPSSKDQERTFRTTVKVSGDTFTTTISGQTACIKD
ncbi:hypothetical protein ACVW00_003166 [Marmoricola sp. URHA0025 HA25]